MKPGQAYLIHCGDWHTFVGRFVEQTSPLLYGFSSVSKIAQTNNSAQPDCWEDFLLEENQETRTAATYRHYPDTGELYELPVSIIAMPWQGKTPQEEQRP